MGVECEGSTAARLAGTLEAKCAGTWTASTTRIMALSESFLKPPVAGDQKASLASLSLELHPFRHLEGFLAWGPLMFDMSGTQRGTLCGVLLCSSVPGA